MTESDFGNSLSHLTNADILVLMDLVSLSGTPSDIEFGKRCAKELERRSLASNNRKE
jgi:hypothetical protein